MEMPSSGDSVGSGEGVSRGGDGMWRSGADRVLLGFGTWGKSASDVGTSESNGGMPAGSGVGTDS